VLDCGDHLAIATPSNPTYYFGNYLLFNRAPRVDDYERWLAFFARAFAGYSAVRHIAFAWSSPEGSCGEISTFLANGFTLDEHVVLTASQARKAPKVLTVETREIRSDADWDTLLQLDLRNRDARFDARGFEAFKRRQIVERRALCDAAEGVWIGAFAGEELVGTCGIFSAGELARYQDVIVDERYRNRGIAKTLLAHAARIGLERFHARALVIVADATHHALALYERAGFAPSAREWALWKSP
jgi:ribosomal protein S18 acetylase RimI-like enzyme